MKYTFTFCSWLCVWSSFAQIQFSDVANLSGLYDSGYNYGVSVVDYNNDGLEDLYVARTIGANRLFKNNGDGTFTDVAASVGLAYVGRSRMGIWGDINNDGWMDLYLGNANGEADALYLNKGKNTTGVVKFTEIGKKLGMDDTAKPFAVVFGDIDNDGFLDIYVAQIDGPNRMWKNNGDLTFTDYTLASGTTDYFVAMGALFFDYDNDLDLDLYLTHDSNDPNILYQNDGTGHFTNVAQQANVDVAAFGMGVDFGDVNNDGWLDLYVTNYGFNNLLLNNGDGTFTDITADSETENPGMGWGTVFLDTDNSGWQDIYVVNTAAIGHPNIMYYNQGDNTFSSVSDQTPLQSGANGYGAATFDYNLDGRIDLTVANSSGNGSYGNHLFKNETVNDNHWVKVKARGMITNRNAIGARIEVIAGDQRGVDIVTGGSGWCSQNSLIQHFGLGAATMIDTLKVTWPSGIVDIRTNLAADQMYTIVEGEKLETAIESPISSNKSIILYPNPVTDKILIDPLEDQFNLRLFNSEGVILLEKAKITAPTFEIDLSQYPAGTYWLEINCLGNTYIEQLIKI